MITPTLEFDFWSVHVVIALNVVSVVKRLVSRWENRISCLWTRRTSYTFFTLLTRSKAKSASVPSPVCNKIPSPFSNGKKKKLSSKLPKTSTIQQPKAGTKSTELAQSLAQGSDLLTDGHETVEEPAVVSEASGTSDEGQQNLLINMNADDLSKVLTDHTKDLSTHWDKIVGANKSFRSNPPNTHLPKWQ